jgi:dUTP pyrophosphatase
MTAEIDAIRRVRSSWEPVPGPAQGESAAGHLVVAVDHPKAKLPDRAHAGDAGLDLYTCESVVIPVGQFRDVPCGIRLQLPVGTWALIKSRSSTLRVRGLLVSEAVIDNGYTGEIYVGVWNLGKVSAVVAEGERVAQLILCDIKRVPVLHAPGEAELVSRDGRAAGGFGSTGK